jgi:acyl carrier protein
MTSDPQSQLHDFITSEFSYKLENGRLDPDDDLLGEGIIDSMGVMQLVTFIEETFGVAVDDDEITPDNFRSLRALTALVSKKTGATGASA